MSNQHYYYICLTAFFPGQPGTRKVTHSGFCWSKRWWGGSGISWTMCKSSAPRFIQISVPVPRHLVFIHRYSPWMVAHNDRRLELNYRLDAFPATQPTASKHWRLCPTNSVQHFPWDDNFCDFSRFTPLPGQLLFFNPMTFRLSGRPAKFVRLCVLRNFCLWHWHQCYCVQCQLHFTVMTDVEHDITLCEIVWNYGYVRDVWKDHEKIVMSPSVIATDLNNLTLNITRNVGQCPTWWPPFPI